MTNIKDVAKVIRSKNSSPFELTLDIIIREKPVYEKIKTKNLITKKLIAQIYRVDESVIQKVIYFDPAKAIKIGMKRLKPSGVPGDTDVYGAQQHAPLLDINLDI